MKKYFYLISFVLLLTSCTEDVKFNNPAFQSLKDNVFWRANAYKAYSGDGGTMIIEGSLGYEKVLLQTASPMKGTYLLGVNDASKAIYSNTFPAQFVAFSTGTKGVDGQIVITEYNLENKTISGTFKFNAINENINDTENPKITFTEGVFYKVPIQFSEITNHL
ncbi:DUF6252 family protein [Flavobacterium sp. JAS]|uniref:DUF6252 family protein n=1 Tax=Flavobacterium sp. JAS TaxID=2897329 RepID=UPI001E61E77E|nr:DUF6252 family protein [Flavobacterium sp. JAS]MCD0468103.1 DUF6252 family protein [Flavobacterium sp. JAS]